MLPLKMIIAILLVSTFASVERDVIFVSKFLKNTTVSDPESRTRAILAPHVSDRPNNFHLHQIYPTSVERSMQSENAISYFPENPNEYIFVHPPLSQNINFLYHITAI
jgi:hypothetical protein